MSDGILILHPSDNVAVLTAKTAAGATPLGAGVPLEKPLQAGHKIARTDLAKGDSILKFGPVIGYATEAIPMGAQVHTHNCEFGDHDKNYEIGVDLDAARAAIPKTPAATFQGYRRKNGQAGTRSYIALCATVNCSATVVRRAADTINSSGLLDAFPNVDGVAAFSHGTDAGLTCDAINGSARDKQLCTRLFRI